MKRYVYYNATPDGRVLNNCVCRAITLATGLRYRTVENLLKLTGKAYRCDCLMEECYRHLLENVFNFERHDCNFKRTVQEITDMYDDCIVLMRVPQHLTVSLYGENFDIFDTTDAPVDCYWIVRR